MANYYNIYKFDQNTQVLDKLKFFLYLITGLDRFVINELHS